MSSLPPSLQVFWAGPVAASRAFESLSGWADIVRAPLPEALHPPRPASHISAAIRRLVEAPQPVHGPDDVAEMLGTLQDRRERAGILLRNSVERILEGLRQPDRTADLLSPLDDWLPEAETGLRSLEDDLQDFRVKLLLAERAGRIPPEGTDWMMDVAGRLHTRLVRTDAQVRAVGELMKGRWNEGTFEEIRRRLSWVLSLREFDRSFDWEALPGFREMPRVTGMTRSDAGMLLLFRFRPDATEREVALYERAASFPLKGRDLAFAVDGVLADAFAREDAEAVLLKEPGRFDVSFQDIVHQYERVRLPRRGLQALLLGLWAAGHCLRVDAADEGREGYEAFFNDFPLLKVAFGLAEPEQAGRLLTLGELGASRRYRDGLKRNESWKRHFQTADGRLALEGLKGARVPFPDFPFELLVENVTDAEERAASRGFGSRWLKPSEDAGDLLSRLENCLSGPVSGVSGLISDWLDVWE
ncbi:MAG TPA: hypothetical protein VFX30_10330 [bacterium]|nr:hypothetical protein [bacterium]